MVILERNTARNEVSLPPSKKNSPIVRLEGQIHARRLEIKGLSASLQMLGTLHVNGLTDTVNFSTARTIFVNRMSELNAKQHLDRKELSPHKKAKETNGKSPFRHPVNKSVPPESKFSVRIVPLRTKDEVKLIKKKTEPVVLYERKKPKKSNRDGYPLKTRITDIRKQLESLSAQKMNGEISPKEYKARQQQLASELHETERQRGNEPFRKKRTSL